MPTLQKKGKSGKLRRILLALANKICTSKETRTTTRYSRTPEIRQTNSGERTRAPELRSFSVCSIRRMAYTPNHSRLVKSRHKNHRRLCSIASSRDGVCKQFSFNPDFQSDTSGDIKKFVRISGDKAIIQPETRHLSG